MFIGRHRELALLNNAWQSGKPELVIVSGRRRIGKTSLLTEFCRGKNALFYSALQTNDTPPLYRGTEDGGRSVDPFYGVLRGLGYGFIGNGLSAGSR